MFRNKKSEILWGLNLRTYMYGSTVVKRQDGSVQFYNPLVPSGTDIKSWSAFWTVMIMKSSSLLEKVLR